MEINVLWLKRDLRIQDHAALQAAALDPRPLLVIYCFEPSQSFHYDFDLRHWRFVYQSLVDLWHQGLPVWAFHEEVHNVFEIIRTRFKIYKVFSHQETGIELTFTRDNDEALLPRQSNCVGGISIQWCFPRPDRWSGLGKKLAFFNAPEAHSKRSEENKLRHPG